MSKRKKSVVNDVQGDKAIILRVASLIEQGSEGMQQITGKYFKIEFGKPVGCCAIGACTRALTNQTNGELSLLNLLGIYTWPRIPYPKGTYTPFAANEQLGTASLPDVVIFLNDRLGWSFTKIVEYLRDATLPKATIIKVKA